MEAFKSQFFMSFFFNNRLNVGCGPAEERILLTGLHAVADIYCESCKTTLGWKYVSVFFTLQYKQKTRKVRKLCYCNHS